MSTKTILDGFGQYLNDAGTGLTFRGDGSAYQPGEVPIFKGTERVVDGAQVILNWVALDDDVEITQGSGVLQVAVIGAPNGADGPSDLTDAVFAALHGATGLTFGDVQIVQCYRTSSVPMGQDATDRDSRADQYRCDVEFPPTSHRS